MLPIPNDRPISPQFTGQVKDSASGNPIQNATVRVEALLSGTPRPMPNTVATTQTDEKGFFRIGVVEHDTWYVLFVGPAEGTCSGTLTVTHPGYEDSFAKVSEFRGAAVNGMCNGFVVARDVLLKRM